MWIKRDKEKDQVWVPDPLRKIYRVTGKGTAVDDAGCLFTFSIDNLPVLALGDEIEAAEYGMQLGDVLIVGRESEGLEQTPAPPAPDQDFLDVIASQKTIQDPDTVEAKIAVVRKQLNTRIDKLEATVAELVKRLDAQDAEVHRLKENK